MLPVQLVHVVEEGEVGVLRLDEGRDELVDVSDAWFKANRFKLWNCKDNADD